MHNKFKIPGCPCPSGRRAAGRQNLMVRLCSPTTNLQFCLAVCILALSVVNISSICFSQDTSKEEEALFIGEKALEDGFYDVALGLFERFLKNYPVSSKLAKVNLLIGQCYFHQNKFLDALSKFEGLLNQSLAREVQDEILYWIAEVHFKGNDFAKAATYYQKIIEEFPKSSYLAASYYSLGWCLFQEAKFNDAIKYFLLVEEKFPKASFTQDASFKIVECLYNLKDYNGLKDKLKAHLKIYAKDAEKLAYLYFYFAEADYYLNNFQEAIEEYAYVLANAKDDIIKSLSKLGTGWSYLKLKRYPEAQGAFLEIKDGTLENKYLDILLLGKAVLFFETNKYAQAKDIYSELLNATKDPVVSIQAYLGKADALYNLAEYKEAINVYKAALNNPLESIPQEIIDKLYYGLAWAQLKEGEFKEAISEFQKIVKNTEDKIVKVAALCQIGDAYQDSGEYDEAVQAYDKILEDYTGSLYGDYVQYQLGLTLLKAAKYDGAILSFLSLKKNFPDSKLLDDASYALGLTYFQREDYTASKEVFEKFQEECPDSPLKSQSLYLLGTSLYNLGKFSEAIEVFKNIKRLFTQDAELMQKADYEIADCYDQMGNEKEAMERFKMLRAKYPDSQLTPEIMWWLGEYIYRHNDLNLARRYFSSLIKDFPKSDLVASCYYAIGSTYVEESNYLQAIENFKKVIDSGKTDLSGTATIALADIYVKQDKLDLALNTYKDVIKQHPNLLNLVYPKIADLYCKMADYEQALEFCRKSLEVVPLRQMADIQFKLAEILQTQGRFLEAVEEYLKVSYLYPENNTLVVKSLLRVAGIYEGQENFKEALNIYNKVISMDAQEAKYAQERIDWIRTHIK